MVFLFTRTGTTPSNIPSDEMKTTLVAKLATVSGDVALIRDGATTTASVGKELKAGDIVQTGQDGQASIEFYSSDRTALDVGSRLHIDEASIDENNWRKQKVRLTLFTGRAWSRALKLLDVDSTYQVGYNNVVTAVRGTAFMITGEPLRYTMDEFAGSVILSGSATGTVGDGLTATFELGTPPAKLANATWFTPDQVRNDHWVRGQLRADEEFAKRATAVRREYGSDDEVGTIGQEAGPFTLDQQGVTHSNFRGVLIDFVGNTPTVSRGDTSSASPGDTLHLIAFALLDDTTGMKQMDVTARATWQVSDASKASIDGKGVLQITASAIGTVGVIARWNDGTHEHSDTKTFTVR